MKSKIAVDVLRSNVERSIHLFSQHLQNKGEKVAFALYENDALKEEVDGKTVMSFGIILEMESELLGSKKLYFRKYDLARAKLADVQKIAYEELFDILLGCFLTTAATAPDEVLLKLSTNRK